MSNVVGLQSKNLSMSRSQTNSDLRHRLQENSKNLNDLLYGHSPFQKRFSRNNSRESSESSNSGKDGHQNGNADACGQQQNGFADDTKYESKRQRRNSQNFETTLKLFKENCKPKEGIKTTTAKSVISRQTVSASNLQNGGTSLNTKQPLTATEKRRLNFQSSREKGTASSFATSFSNPSGLQAVNISAESSPKDSGNLADVKSQSYHGEDSLILLNSASDLHHCLTNTAKNVSATKSANSQNAGSLELPLIHSKVLDAIKETSTNHVSDEAATLSHVTSGAEVSNHVTSEFKKYNHVTSRAELTNHVTSEFEKYNHVTDGAPTLSHVTCRAEVTNHVASEFKKYNHVPDGAPTLSHVTPGTEVSNHVTPGSNATNQVAAEIKVSNRLTYATELSNHVTYTTESSNQLAAEIKVSNQMSNGADSSNQNLNGVESRKSKQETRSNQDKSNEHVHSRKSNLKKSPKFVKKDQKLFNSKSMDNLHLKAKETSTRLSTEQDIDKTDSYEKIHSKSFENSTNSYRLLSQNNDHPSAFSLYQGQGQAEVAESVTDSAVEMDLTSSFKSIQSCQDQPDSSKGVRKFCDENIEFNQSKSQNGLDGWSESPKIRTCLRKLEDTSGLDFTFFVQQNSHTSKGEEIKNAQVLSPNKSSTEEQLERELADITWRQRRNSGRTKNSGRSLSTTVIGRHLVITPDLFIDDTVPDTTPHAMSELEKMIAKKYQQKRAASPHHRKQLHIIRRPQSVPAQGRVLYPSVVSFDPVQPAARVETTVTNEIESDSPEPIYMNAIFGNESPRDVIAKPPRPNKRCYVKRNSKLNPEAIYSSMTSRGFQIYKRDGDGSMASERTSRKDHIKNIQRLFENSSKDGQNTVRKSPNLHKNQEQSSLNSFIKFESRSNHSINEKQCLGKNVQNSQNGGNLQKNMSIKSNTSQVTMRSVASQVSDPENLATGKQKQNLPPKKFKFKNMWKHKKGKYQPSLEDLSNLNASKIHSNFKSLPNICSNKDFESNICMSLPNSPGVKNSLSVVDMGDIAKLDNMLTKQYFGNTEFDQIRKSKNKKSGAKSLEEMKKLFYSEPSISLKRSHEDLKGSTHFSSATTEYHTSLVTGIVNDDTLSDINPDIFDSDAAGSTDNGLFLSSKSLNRDKNSSRASSNSGSRSPFVHSSSVVPEPEIPKANPTIEISRVPDKNPELSDSFTISDVGVSQVSSLQLSSCYYSSTQRESESDTEPLDGINHSPTKSAFHPVVGHSKVQGQSSNKVDDDITSVSSLSVSTTTRGFSVSESAHDTDTDTTFQPYSKTASKKKSKDSQNLAKSSKVFSDNLAKRLSYTADDSDQPSLIQSQGKKIETTDDKSVVSVAEDIEMSTFSIQAQDSFDFSGNFDADLLRAKRKGLTKMASVQSPIKQVYDLANLKTDEPSHSLNTSELSTELTKKTESQYSSPTREIIPMTELTPKTPTADPLYARVNKGRKAKEMDPASDQVIGGLPLYAAINKERKLPLQTSDGFTPRHLSTSTGEFSLSYATVQDSVADQTLTNRNPSPPYATVEECAKSMSKLDLSADDEYFVRSPPYESLDECRGIVAEVNSIETVEKSENSFENELVISPPYASVDECKAEITHDAQPIYTSVEECLNEARDITVGEPVLNETESFTHYESVVDLKTKTPQNSSNEAPAEKPDIPKSSSQCSLYQTIDQVRGQIDEGKSDSGIQVEDSERDMPLGGSACSQLREDLYAKVGNYRKKSVNGAECIVSNRSSLDGDEMEVLSDEDQGPPLPARRYKTDSSSNLTKNNSSSRLSLLNKMGLIKNSTKTKIKSFRKAVSLERGLDDVGSINTPSKTEKLEKSKTKIRKAPSLKSLTALFGKKSKSKKEKSDSVLSVFDDSPDKLPVKNSTLSLSKKKLWSSAKNLEINSVEPPKMLRSIGKLLEICSDGSKVVELRKPPDGPIGFYIGRGTANYDYGIFISRFSDESLEKLFSGLMSVGDEVIEINQRPIRDLSMDDVYGLMADKSKLVLRIFPIASRRDL